MSEDNLKKVQQLGDLLRRSNRLRTKNEANAVDGSSPEKIKEEQEADSSESGKGGKGDSGASPLIPQEQWACGTTFPLEAALEWVEGEELEQILRNPLLQSGFPKVHDEIFGRNQPPISMISRDFKLPYWRSFLARAREIYSDKADRCLVGAMANFYVKLAEMCEDVYLAKESPEDMKLVACATKDILNTGAYRTKFFAEFSDYHKKSDKAQETAYENVSENVWGLLEGAVNKKLVRVPFYEEHLRHMEKVEREAELNAQRAMNASSSVTTAQITPSTRAKVFITNCRSSHVFGGHGFSLFAIEALLHDLNTMDTTLLPVVLDGLCDNNTYLNLNLVGHKSNWSGDYTSCFDRGKSHNLPQELTCSNIFVSAAKADVPRFLVHIALVNRLFPMPTTSADSRKGDKHLSDIKRLFVGGSGEAAGFVRDVNISYYTDYDDMVPLAEKMWTKITRQNNNEDKLFRPDSSVVKIPFDELTLEDFVDVDILARIGNLWKTEQRGRLSHLRGASVGIHIGNKNQNQNSHKSGSGRAHPRPGQGRSGNGNSDFKQKKDKEKGEVAPSQ